MASSAGFDVAGILAGFQQQHIGAALDQRLRLVVVVLDQFREGDAAGTEMAFVVGPIEPATKRGRPASRTRPPPARASFAAAKFSSYALSCRSYSARTTRLPPKLLVSTMSEPAS